MEGSDSEFVNFTLPTLKGFFEACSHNVSGNKQLLVAHAMPQNAFFLQTHDLLAKKQCKDTSSFFHPPSPFHGNFCNSIGICTASQF